VFIVTKESWHQVTPTGISYFFDAVVVQLYVLIFIGYIQAQAKASFIIIVRSTKHPDVYILQCKALIYSSILKIYCQLTKIQVKLEHQFAKINTSGCVFK